MQTIVLTGISLYLPTSWDEVTVEQFNRLTSSEGEKLKQLVNIVSIFSGIPYAELFDTEATAEDMERLEAALSFIKELPDFKSAPVPETITVGDKEIKIPKDITLKTYGQFQEFQIRILEHAVIDKDGAPRVPINLFPDAAGIYLYPEYSGKKLDTLTDDYKKFCAELELHTMREMYALTDFFLRKQLGLTMPNETISEETRQARKSERELKILINTNS